MHLGPISIGFTGTRHGMTEAQHQGVVKLLSSVNALDVTAKVFHHGDCVGADLEAHKIAISLDYVVVVHPPLKQDLRAFCEGVIIHPAKPYEQRNRDIVMASSLMIAAPPTEQEQSFGGTWQTVRFAREYNKPCKVVLPSGIVVDA
jgi:hypothetical protein